MFFQNREKVAKALSNLQYDVCCYMSPTRCDCKYGYPGHRQPGKAPPEHRHYSEQTGCPELRSMTLLLNAMTDEEYYDLCKRAGGVLL